VTWAAVATLVAGWLLLGHAPVRVDRRRPPRRLEGPAGPRLSRPAAWWASAGLLALMLLVWLPPGSGTLGALAVVPLVGMVGPRVLVRVERRRGRGDAPGTDVALAADLVAASLAAGVPLMGAVRATGAAVGGEVGALLLEVSHRHAVGADPASAVAGLSAGASTARLGRALLRATESGMSPVDVLQAAAEAERGRRRSDRVSRARAAGSLAALPLGLFFLPAFVLVAVVPVVVGSLAGVLTPG